MLNRPPRRARRTAPALVPALAAATALLTTAGCSDMVGGADAGAGAADRAAGSASPAAARAVSPSPSVTVAPTLTEAQAGSALIGPADLGDGWTPTGGAATWRDALLKGKPDTADCRRLLDGLYAEDLLGGPVGARSVAGFDRADGVAQLRYQVGAYDRAALDEALTWLKRVPETCGEFTATDARGGQVTVRTAAAPPPGLGEARAGLRVTVNGYDYGDGDGDEDGDEDGYGDGQPAFLTLDFAAVRVGDSALSLTHGGLADIDAEDTRKAVEAGTRRLEEVLAGRTPPAPRETVPAVQPPGERADGDVQGRQDEQDEQDEQGGQDEWG
ncbi:hypothetical protein [Streptomyces beigongshangae]|uniref:hypothetical protein n=1 Tax=Streptomyces beigongshangae TaxID=2841597 RepID=UPI001C84781B|nr:hypothetical protein [Streptomyces sp. REN17]